MQLFGSPQDDSTTRPGGFDSDDLTSPMVFLWSMLVFLALAGFVAAVLGRQITTAFSTNPGLNGLIVGVLVVGILLALIQIIRLAHEVRWVNAYRNGSADFERMRDPVLLAPMRALIGRRRSLALSTQSMRAVLDSVATRLDETRDIARYLTGLLVFLGLLGTFWGLLGTIGSIGDTIRSLDPGGGDTSSVLDSLKAGLAAPLQGMGTAFSSSLFGLSGSLVLGFLDLQIGRAQNRFYTELENWLSSVTDVGSDMLLPPAAAGSAAGGDEMRALADRLAKVVAEQGTGARTTAAMAGLAESIQGLVQHMRSEQQMLRDFVESQASEQREMRDVLERLSGSLANAEAGRLTVALSRNRRAERTIDYWPGFVDALSTLLLAIMFLLSVFVLAQFLLSREISGRDEVLDRLNSQINELTQLLSLERGTGQDYQDQIASLQASLQEAEAGRSKLQQALESGSGSAETASAEAGRLRGELEGQKTVAQRAVAHVELLNQQLTALRQQIAALEDALEASESRDRESQTRIADLGSRLNVALAQRVQELSRYRSDFFGRLREILSDRENIRIVGDRFVFQSEVLFPSGSDVLQPTGTVEMQKLAAAIVELSREIPSDINWIIRVDGHTDNVPITGAGRRFADNWQLSTARAAAVVRYLISQGAPANRLAATGFGEFQPLDQADTPEARDRNRRIELKLTER